MIYQYNYKYIVAIQLIIDITINDKIYYAITEVLNKVQYY